MDPIELAIHRENTTAFIASNPTDVVLIPIDTREKTPSGGYKDTPGAPRASQRFRIIELGQQSLPPVLQLQDGSQRVANFWLLGQWDAAVAVGDSWTSEDQREWEVGEIVRSNHYETRALVAERGA